ncbi:hypothetical protein HDV00_005106 [Rhizophlyctis rosea]|nr:hypothetical protein HDV00_005106 [Rhizophlyctis rosea]
MTSVKPAPESDTTTKPSNPTSQTTTHPTPTDHHDDHNDPDAEGSLIHLADTTPSPPKKDHQNSSSTSTHDAPPKPTLNAFTTPIPPTPTEEKPDPVPPAATTPSATKSFFSFGKRSKTTSTSPATPAAAAASSSTTSTTPATPATTKQQLPSPSASSDLISTIKPEVIDKDDDAEVVDSTSPTRDDGQPGGVRAGTDLVSERFVESVGGAGVGAVGAKGKGKERTEVHPFEVGEE